MLNSKCEGSHLSCICPVFTYIKCISNFLQLQSLKLRLKFTGNIIYPSNILRFSIFCLLFQIAVSTNVKYWLIEAAGALMVF